MLKAILPIWTFKCQTFTNDKFPAYPVGQVLWSGNTLVRASIPAECLYFSGKPSNYFHITYIIWRFLSDFFQQSFDISDLFKCLMSPSILLWCQTKLTSLSVNPAPSEEFKKELSADLVNCLSLLVVHLIEKVLLSEELLLDWCTTKLYSLYFDSKLSRL